MGAAEDVPGEGVPDGPGDRDLLEALRSGDDEAYALLWRRHHPAALRAARQYDHSTEAEDIAAEAFARVLDAVRRGNGPRESFRAYLLRAVANVAQNAARTRRRTVVAADESVLDSPVVHDDPAIEALDQHYIAQAFERLTPPQKEVLWYVEVEQTPTKDAAAMMGLTANATSQMAGRARDALSREFLQMHIDDRPDDPQCTAALSRMGRYALGSLTRPQRKRVDTHVTGCVACADALAVVCDLRASMREILGPLVVGSTAMGYFGAAAGGKAVGAAAGAGAGASGGGATPRGPNTARNLAAAAVVAVMLAGAALAAVLIAGGGDPPKEEGDAGGQSARRGRR